MPLSHDARERGGGPRDNLVLAVLTLAENQKIPDAEYRKIARVHNSRVGHFGLEKTLEALRKSDHIWKGMRRHIKQFIKQCPVCQLTDDRKVQVKVAPFTRAVYSQWRY